LIQKFRSPSNGVGVSNDDQNFFVAICWWGQMFLESFRWVKFWLLQRSWHFFSWHPTYPHYWMMIAKFQLPFDTPTPCPISIALLWWSKSLSCHREGDWKCFGPCNIGD
jgi:hypothetical protein